MEVMWPSLGSSLNILSRRYPMAPAPNGLWCTTPTSSPQLGFGMQQLIGNGPNTVSESTVSNTELSELFCPHRVPGRELSEFLSAYYLCAKANSPSFSQNSPSLPQNLVRLSEFPSPKQCSRNSIPPVS